MEIREKLKFIILDSPYANKVNCILRHIEAANLVTWARLQDLPSQGHICGVDVYQLLATINENWEKDYASPKKTTKRKKVVEDEVINMEEDNG